ncbi:MAG: xylulokinase [Asgard group archaeon]|nr:xylulokinase [Asgard group archaeon]
MTSTATPCLLSIDIGTTGGRSVIFSSKGEILASAYKEYSCEYPSPICVEQNAEDWWQVTKETIKNVLKKTPSLKSNLAGVSVTNQRETIVPVSENGKPLSKAIVWQDRRTTEECEIIKEKIGLEKIYEKTGLTIDPYFSGPKILWIKKNLPDIYKQTHKFLLVHDYIQYKFTSQFITDFSNASRTMLFNINKLEWASSILNILEIAEEKLPQPYPSGKTIDTITNTAAKESGLPKDLPVITGGGDQQCAALGVGVTKKGRIKATTGTGTFLLAYLEKSKRDPEKRVLCSCHTIPGKYVLEASIFTTGSILRWFRDNFSSAEKSLAPRLDLDTYDLLAKQAESIPAGSEGVFVLPHFTGAGAPHWNPSARGLIFGLGLGHTRNHIIRAIMEATCYEIRLNLEIMKNLQVPLKELRITGGASKSELWNQIQANITGLNVIKGRISEATALGAAILAAAGTNIYSSIEQAAENMIKIEDKISPIKKDVEQYSEYFNIYSKLYQIIESNNLYNELGKIR